LWCTTHDQTRLATTEEEAMLETDKAELAAQAAEEQEAAALEEGGSVEEKKEEKVREVPPEEEGKVFEEHLWIGLAFPKTETTTQAIDLVSAKQGFIDMIRDYNTRKAGMAITVDLVSRKNLPEFVFPEGEAKRPKNHFSLAKKRKQAEPNGDGTKKSAKKAKK
jgi:poly(A) polymerase Pap1